MSCRNVVSWSTLISGYCKDGDLDTARMLFDKMPTKSLVPWTFIIAGYADKGFGNEANSLYNQMEAAGLALHEGATVSTLATSAESGLLDSGKKVHASIEIDRFKGSTLVFNALDDLYAKCDCLDDALRIFDGKTYILIKGMVMNGEEEKALLLFTQMKHEGYAPDGFTLIGLLCVCTHAGLVEKGLDHFHQMLEGNAPMVEHSSWAVDILCRSGSLKEALMLVQSMPFAPNPGAWTTLLGACRAQNDPALAAQVLHHASKSNSLKSLRPSPNSSYSDDVNSILQTIQGE